MKYLFSIYVWTFGLLAFALILGTTGLLSYLFPREKYDPWLQWLLRCYFRLVFVRVKSQGGEKLRGDRAYLFMANHVSMFDLPLLAAYVPVCFRGVSAREQFDWPGFGWFLRRYGNVPIDRDSVHGSMASLRKAADLLRAGESITILPEGGRTEDGNLGRFKKLPFLLAREAAVDVVPIGLAGLFEVKNKRSWLVRPGTIEIKFGEVIPAERVTSLSNRELSDLVRREIAALIEG